MTNWKRTLELSDVYFKRNGECGREEWTNKTIHELAKEIARRLNNKFYDRMIDGHNVDFLLVEIYDAFQGISTEKQYQEAVAYAIGCSQPNDSDVVEYYTPLVEFNETMSMLYDWADTNEVWINK